MSWGGGGEQLTLNDEVNVHLGVVSLFHFGGFGF